VPDLVQVLIQGVVSLSIESKSGSRYLYLIRNYQKDAGRDALEILPGPSRKAQNGKLNSKTKSVIRPVENVNLTASHETRRLLLGLAGTIQASFFPSKP